MASRRQRRARGKNASGGKFPKWLGLAGGVVLLAALVGLLLGYRAMRGYLKSEEFRVMLTEEAGDFLQAEAEINPLVWEGWTARTDEIRVQDTNAVQMMTVHDLEADIDISAVLDDAYHIEDVRLRELEVFADLTLPRGEAPPKRDRKKTFWSEYLPKNYKVSLVEIARIYGQAKTARGSWLWDEFSTKVTPGQGTGVYDVEINNGRLETPLAIVPEAKLENARARYADGQLFLLEAHANILEDAHLQLSGDYTLADKAWKVKGELTGARCDELVAENWKQRLKGEFRSQFSVRAKPTQIPIVRGSLELADGVLTALPVLDRIAAYADTSRFRRLVLSEATLDYRQEGTLLKLMNIRLGSEGLVRLVGEMTVEGNVIRKGDFRLGITPGTLARIPGAETKVFQRGEQGLLWTDLRVSGTLDDPQEDLSDRLMAAAGERMFEQAADTGKTVLKFGGEIMEGSVKKILDQDGLPLPLHPLKTGTDILTEGVGKVFDLLGSPLKKEE